MRIKPCYLPQNRLYQSPLRIPPGLLEQVQMGSKHLDQNLGPSTCLQSSVTLLFVHEVPATLASRLGLRPHKLIIALESLLQPALSPGPFIPLTKDTEIYNISRSNWIPNFHETSH